MMLVVNNFITFNLYILSISFCFSFFIYNSYLRIFLERKKLNLVNFKVDLILLVSVISIITTFGFLYNEIDYSYDPLAIEFVDNIKFPTVYHTIVLAGATTAFLINSCYIALTFFINTRGVTQQFKLVRNGILIYLGIRFTNFIIGIFLFIISLGFTFIGLQYFVKIMIGLIHLLPIIAICYLLIYPVTLLKMPKRFNSHVDDQKKNIRKDINKLYQKLKKIIEGNDLYLLGTLNIRDLSLESSLSKSEIRIILNENGFNNFKSFCHFFQLMEVENQIKNGDLSKYKMKVLYEKAGFNSHQTFNRSFRKKHGITALEYWKNIEDGH
jgi:AraC-like DNA-binding protein